MHFVQRPGAGRALALACATVATFAASTARAESIYGAAAIFTDRFCPTAATSCVGVDADGNSVPAGPRISPSQLYGGYGTGLSASSTLAGGASAAADVSFGGDYLPIVRLGSSAGAETRTGASVTTFRSFTYNGSESINFALAGEVHFFSSGDVDGPFPANEYAGDGTLNVVLSLWRVSDIASRFGPSTTPLDIFNDPGIGFPNCGGGALAAEGYNSTGVAAGEHFATVGLSQGCDGGAITLNSGDSFVVVASLQALSNRNGFLDAMNTVTVRYDDAHTYISGTGQSVGEGFLSRAITEGAAVPEPSTWALLLGGFGLAGVALRRRRSALVA